MSEDPKKTLEELEGHVFHTVKEDADGVSHLHRYR